MLSTPPAFILSQDQTLMFNLSTVWTIAFVFRRDLSRLLFLVRLLDAFSLFSLRIFEIALLFNFQGSFCCCLRQLCYTNTAFLSCQQLFKIIFRCCFRDSFVILAQPVVSCQQLFENFLVSFQRRRRDLNPRAAINDLHPFQGCPFSLLGTSPNYWTCFHLFN